MKHTRWSCGLFVLLAVGCAPPPSVRWLREDVHPVAVRGDRRLDRVRIWTHDSVLQWRAVLVTRDSISGIPDQVAQQCDSCRLVLPVSVVDSLSVGYPETRRPPKASDVLLLIAILML